MASLRPSDVFPDLRLADHSGSPRTLAELAGADPVVLHTYRGWWCPKEQTYFRRRLLPLQEEMEVGYARIVSLSVDPPPVTAAFRAGLGARWTFLCDPERSALEELGLRETTDTVNHPYVPAVFTLEPGLRIRTAFNGYWFWGRPTVDELVADLRAITRETRDDWDAPTP
jgi:peroxiredoxin